MEQLEIEMTYKEAHMLIAGAGGIVAMLGPPPQEVMGALRAIGNFIDVFSGDPTYHPERELERFTLTVDELQLDALVSCTACMHALIKNGNLSDCPHTEDEAETLGLALEAKLNAMRVRGD